MECVNLKTCMALSHGEMAWKKIKGVIIKLQSLSQYNMQLISLLLSQNVVAVRCIVNSSQSIGWSVSHSVCLSVGQTKFLVLATF